MNEAESRSARIDPALKATGLGVIKGSHVLREQGITLGLPRKGIWKPTAESRMRGMFRTER